MTLHLGVLMDPIASIKPHKDTTFAMLLEAQARHMKIYYLEPKDIWLQDGLIWARTYPLRVQDNPTQWFELGNSTEQPLTELDVLLMRKDPPFNMEYIYLTYLLEQAEANGLWVLNKPASLRDANEKLYATQFPQCCPKTVVTSQPDLLKEFAYNEEEIVIKPLGGMAG